LARGVKPQAGGSGTHGSDVRNIAAGDDVTRPLDDARRKFLLTTARLAPEVLESLAALKVT
jgi:hypothetical protein